MTWQLAAAVVLGTVGVARATRLLVADAYPPAVALRRWWLNQTVMKGGWRAGWAPLLSGDDGSGGCPFCAAPYVAAVSLVWALLAGVQDPGIATGSWAWWWWVLNLWAAVSYAAAMLVVRDEPPAE